MKQVFTFLFACIISLSLYAQPGTVDSSFGINGRIIRSDLQGAYQHLNLRADGKILATRLADTTAYVTQYNQKGIPEKTIRLAAIDIHGSYGIKKGTFKIVRPQPGGKIFAAGDMYDLDETIVFIARFDKNGSLDSSFATNGVVQYGAGNFPGSLQFIVQPDNKLLLSVLKIYDAVPTIETPVLIRYLPNGVLDSAFGNNGQVLNITKHTNMLLQHGGKIVLTYGYKNIQVSRRNIDGSLDSSFGKKGTAVINVPYVDVQNDSYYNGPVLMQPDDKIVITGEIISYNPSLTYTTCTRINANGTLDRSFANNGFIRSSLSPLSSFTEPTAAVLQLNGKIIIGGRYGFYYPPTPDSSVLFRLNADGRLDRNFGNNGYMKNAHAKGFAIYDIALQQNGKILTCGFQVIYSKDVSFLKDHPAIARYKGDSFNSAIVKNNAPNTKIIADEINAYPNPAVDILHIRTNKSSVIVFTHSSGKIIWTGRVSGSKTINLSSLPSGVYFLSNPQRQVVKKIVINH